MPKIVIIDVILNPNESIVELNFSQVRLEKGVTVIKSQENKAYWEFKEKDVAVQKKIKALKKQRGQYRSQGNEVKVNEITNEVNKNEKELFDFIQVIINKYPTTYFSKAKVASKASNIKDKDKYIFAGKNRTRSARFLQEFSQNFRARSAPFFRNREFS